MFLLKYFRIPILGLGLTNREGLMVLIVLQPHHHDLELQREQVCSLGGDLPGGALQGSCQGAGQGAVAAGSTGLQLPSGSGDNRWLQYWHWMRWWLLGVGRWVEPCGAGAVEWGWDDSSGTGGSWLESVGHKHNFMLSFNGGLDFDLCLVSW